jgi:peptidoglycan/LPS O-acetylase OafA/YrhL
VRAISMMWIVFGHYYLNSVGGVLNTLNLSTIILKPFFLIVETGLLAVDIFFFLAGFFLAFVFLREKGQRISTYLLAIIQRVLRIWPAYILVMMIYYSFFMHLGDGPRWQFHEPVINICSKMWRSIIFVDNLVDNGE